VMSKRGGVKMNTTSIGGDGGTTRILKWFESARPCSTGDIPGVLSVHRRETTCEEGGGK
jgi:hypothetical protein